MLIPRTKPITQKRLAQLQNERNRTEYREWRKAVLVRDESKCQYPGCVNDSKNSKLEVHHIKEYYKYKHLRTAIINGIVLCESCHKKVTGFEHRYELVLFTIAKKNTDKYEEDKKRQQNKTNSGHEGTTTT